MTTPDAEDERLVDRAINTATDATLSDEYSRPKWDRHVVARGVLLAHLASQRASLAEARAEIARLTERAEKAEKLYRGTREALNVSSTDAERSLRTQLREAQEALGKYGFHLYDCDVQNAWGDYVVCDCGFEAALSATGEKEKL